MQDLPKVATVFDSEEEHVGEVYAKALLGVVRKLANTDEVLSQFNQVVDEVFAKNPKLEAALSSPRLSLEQKESLLEKVLGGRIDVQLLRFLKVICRRDRLNFVRGIQRSVIALRDTELGRVQVVVTSAFALDEAAKANIRVQLEKKLDRKVSLLTKVDPTVVGGLVLRIGDTVFDGSVAGKFEQMLRSTKLGSAKALSRDMKTLVS